MYVWYNHKRTSDSSEVINPRIDRPCLGVKIQSDASAEIQDLRYFYLPEQGNRNFVISYTHGFRIPTDIPVGKYYFLFVSGERPASPSTPHEGTIRTLGVTVEPGRVTEYPSLPRDSIQEDVG